MALVILRKIISFLISNQYSPIFVSKMSVSFAFLWSTVLRCCYTSNCTNLSIHMAIWVRLIAPKLADLLYIKTSIVAFMASRSNLFFSVIVLVRCEYCFVHKIYNRLSTKTPTIAAIVQRFFADAARICTPPLALTCSPRQQCTNKTVCKGLRR